MRGVAACFIGLTVLFSGCGLLAPEVDCTDIPRDACNTAVALARSRLIEDRGGEALPRIARIKVEPGCGDRPCPEVVTRTAVMVTFEWSDGSDPERVMLRRSEIGLPDG